MKGANHYRHPQSWPRIPSTSDQGINTGSWEYKSLLIIILIVSFFSYLPVLHNGLLDWDDYGYINNNPLIFSINLKEIFSHNVMWNYHPLTILTLAIEYQFFGLNPTGYHVVNLFLHLLNVILVYYAVALLSERAEVALIASLLFGIHPMHVESVAWVSELKDVLYTFFFLSSYIFYLKYLKDSKNRYYIMAILLFLASLLSKAMAASLPLILLLTDYFKHRKMNRKVLLEKVPFFLLSIILGIVAVYAQDTSLGNEDVGLTFLQRIVFACYGYITYLTKLALPVHLSAFYPYPMLVAGEISFKYYAFVLLVLVLFALVYYSIRFSRKIVFGLGFFTLTIFLVLQWLPVGNAVMADRYSYIPSIGIFYLAAEALILFWDKNYKLVTILLVSLVTLFFSVITYERCGIWKNDLSLWNDVLRQFQYAPVAYHNRGLAYLKQKEYDKALEDFDKAIAQYPGYTQAHINRGNVLRNLKKYDDALNDYSRAIALQPNYYKAYLNRGILFLKYNNNEQALLDFNKAIALNPTITEAYVNRGITLMNEKKYDQAIADYNKAIKLNPNYTDAYINKGNAFSMKNNYGEAIDNFSIAIKLNPQEATAYFNKGLTEFNSGNKEAACADLRQAAILGYQPAIDAFSELCK